MATATVGDEKSMETPEPQVADDLLRAPDATEPTDDCPRPSSNLVPIMGLITLCAFVFALSLMVFVR